MSANTTAQASSGPSRPEARCRSNSLSGIARVLEEVRRVPVAEDVGDDKSPLSLPLRRVPYHVSVPGGRPAKKAHVGGRWLGGWVT